MEFYGLIQSLKFIIGVTLNACKESYLTIEGITLTHGRTNAIVGYQQGKVCLSYIVKFYNVLLNISFRNLRRKKIEYFGKLTRIYDVIFKSLLMTSL